MEKKPRYIEVDGFRLPATFDPELFRAATKYKPGENDVVIPTYPKCGTTWVQQITLLILRKGQPPLTAEEYFESLPFFEATEIETLEKVPKPRILKTHLPFDRVTFSKEAKYICVTRHPVDCVVSFYHHTKYFPIYFFTDGNFDDFFDLFIKGETDFGDYFDHLLSWYEERNKPNVLFITYEDLKADHRGAILKVARFLGEEYYKCVTENDEEILKKILHYSSFEYMKSTINDFWYDGFLNVPYDEQQNKSLVLKNFTRLMEEATKSGHVSAGQFVRRGNVGEGKIVLSEDQLEKLNDRIREKTSHSDVMKLWKTN